MTNDASVTTAGSNKSIAHQQLPIGVFDSGVGGLTVLQALRERLPRERFIYLGDTARLPYGTKSAHSVVRYSLQAASYLVGYGIKYLVVACNTASSVALSALRTQFAPLPVEGVIEAGAVAACAATKSGHIGVLATEGTIRGSAYQSAIVTHAPSAAVSARACSLFVALAEEGWTDGEIAQATARRYLQDMFAEDPAIDTLLLGCTHFPVLRNALRHVLGDDIAIVDSAHTTAEVLARALVERGLSASAQQQGGVRFLATDGADRFARVGSLFLGQAFDPDEVEIVDLNESIKP